MDLCFKDSVFQASSPNESVFFPDYISQDSRANSINYKTDNMTTNKLGSFISLLSGFSSIKTDIPEDQSFSSQKKTAISKKESNILSPDQTKRNLSFFRKKMQLRHKRRYERKSKLSGLNLENNSFNSWNKKSRRNSLTKSFNKSFDSIRRKSFLEPQIIAIGSGVKPVF